MSRQDGTVERTEGQSQGMRSGEVASTAGVNVQTLRYYERRGLLAQPKRNPAGHRQYPTHTVTLLRMIKNAQHLGLSLDEIAGIVAATPDADRISPLVERRVAEIDAQIAELSAIRAVLASYARRGGGGLDAANETPLDFKSA